MIKRLFFAVSWILIISNTILSQDFWQEINTGLTDLSVRAIAVGDSGYIFTATPEGIFRSSNNGASWQVLPGTNGVTVQSLAIDHEYIYAGTELGMFRSTNNGANWSPINNGLPADTLVLAIAVNGSRHVFAGTDLAGLYRSTDFGNTWTRLAGGLTSDDIAALVITPSGTIYAGSDDVGVFRSTDNGDTWTQYNRGMTEPLVRALASNSNGDVFLGGNSEGMFRLAAGDTMWRQINSGLTTTFIGSLGINEEGTIYAGTSGGGVFRSTNNGNSWEEVNTGLLDLFVYAIAFDSEGFIYAGTATGGDFRSVQPITTVAGDISNSPTTFLLKQNYPNPFNPVTKIQYVTSKASHVTVRIYNVLGELVKTLDQGMQDAGTHSMLINASDLASGVYIYRLSAGTRVDAKKMALIK